MKTDGKSRPIVALILVLLIPACLAVIVFKRGSVANTRRFKEVVRGQIEISGPKLAKLVESADPAAEEKLPEDLCTFMSQLRNGIVSSLGKVCSVELYVLDPADTDSLLVHHSWMNQDLWRKNFVVQDFEVGMREALMGNADSLDAINDKMERTWHAVVRGSTGQPLAAVRVDDR